MLRRRWCLGDGGDGEDGVAAVVLVVVVVGGCCGCVFVGCKWQSGVTSRLLLSHLVAVKVVLSTLPTIRFPKRSAFPHRQNGAVVRVFGRVEPRGRGALPEAKPGSPLCLVRCLTLLTLIPKRTTTTPALSPITTTKPRSTNHSPHPPTTVHTPPPHHQHHHHHHHTLEKGLFLKRWQTRHFSALRRHSTEHLSRVCPAGGQKTRWGCAVVMQIFAATTQQALAFLPESMQAHADHVTWRYLVAQRVEDL